MYCIATYDQIKLIMNKDKKQEVKYPKGEDVCVTCYTRDNIPLFLITTKPSTGYFFIYEFTENGLVRLGRSQSPLELEERFDVRKRMGVD